MVHASGNLVQTPAPSWGLARISSNHKLSPMPPLPGYIYDSTAGAGARAYVVDTGILITHVVFTRPSFLVIGQLD